jgi:hypothetical protein
MPSLDNHPGIVVGVVVDHAASQQIITKTLPLIPSPGI